MYIRGLISRRTSIRHTFGYSMYIRGLISGKTLSIRHTFGYSMYIRGLISGREHQLDIHLATQCI